MTRTTSIGPGWTSFRLPGEDTQAKRSPPASTQGGPATGDAASSRHVRRDNPSGVLRQMSASWKQQGTQTQAMPHEDFGWRSHDKSHLIPHEGMLRFFNNPPSPPAVHDPAALDWTKAARELALQLITEMNNGQLDPQGFAGAVGLMKSDPAQNRSLVRQSEHLMNGPDAFHHINQTC